MKKLFFILFFATIAICGYSQYEAGEPGSGGSGSAGTVSDTADASGLWPVWADTASSGIIMTRDAIENYVATTFPYSSWERWFRDAGWPIQVMSIGCFNAIATTSYQTTAVDNRMYLIALDITHVVQIDTLVLDMGNVNTNYNGNYYNGVVIYSLSGSTYTMVDTSTRSNTLWDGDGDSSNDLFKIPMAHTSTLYPNIRYYAGFLYNSSSETTVPIFNGCGVLGTGWATQSGNGARPAFYVPTLNAPPTSFTTSSISTSYNLFYVGGR